MSSPVIGSNGEVYVSTHDRQFHAVDRNGVVQWSIPVGGVWCWTVVGGQTVFTADVEGWVYSVDGASGTVNWSTQLWNSLASHPALSADGFLYCHDDDDVLYCLNQEDGSVEWYCPCLEYGPTWPRPHRDPWYEMPGITVTDEGWILVPGLEALYSVRGPREGTLADAPWAKSQHDRFNTGNAGGR
jgi:outer membrane protein assembly factor BamB